VTIAEAELGLRERKRLATRRAIQRAVLTLALQRGYDKVTVDDVSQEADISPRTFFNYFPSKEVAAIGELPSLPNAEHVEAFVNAGESQSLLDGVRDLIVLTADDDESGHERDIHEMRRELLKINPHLFSLRMVTMKQFEEDFTEIIARRIEKDDPELAAEDGGVLGRARLVTYVAFAGMRHAWSCWADAGGTGKLSARVRDSFDQLKTLGVAAS
jgi:AcrR family transcriptional regulator